MKTHQELLEAYTKAKTSVIYEFSANTTLDMCKLRWSVALYAQENSLDYPEGFFTDYDDHLEWLREDCK